MASTIVLHVEQYGAGSPPVILLHGFGGSARNFRAQARALSGTHRVVVYDSRGHARSAAPSDPAEYKPEALIDDLGRVLDEHGDGPAVIGGLSMGASIALRFAIMHPERVTAIVLASFPPKGDRSPTSWALRFADAIEARGLESAGSEFVWGGARFDNESARFIRQGFLEHRPHALVAILRHVIAEHPSIAELREALSQVAIPALVIAGANDAASLVPSRDLASALPRARLEVVPNSGHVVNLDKPKIFNEILVSFLREIDG